MGINEQSSVLSSASFVQPTDIPGTIDTDVVQPFPPIDEIIAKEDPEIPVYGVYAWYNYFDDFWKFQDELVEIGWTSVRIGGDLTEIVGQRMHGDQVMSNLINNNVEIFKTLFGEARGNFGEFGIDANDIAFINAFLDGIDINIGRYGPDGTFFSDNPSVPYKPIIYWEIWNEPNLHYLTGAAYYSALNMQEKAELYAKLLVASYQHIRANPAWDDVKVIGLSACGVSRNDIWDSQTQDYKGFIEIVHEQGNLDWDNDGHFDGNVANSYDILSDHPYVHAAPPDSEYILPYYHYSISSSFKDYRQTMSDYGNIDKPVWFTEIGWHRENGQYPANATFPVSERIQAAYVCRMYLTAMRLGVERVHIMFMMDADNYNGGFFTRDKEWYESAYAVQNMINIMPKPKISGAISDGTEGYYAYTINPNTDITPATTIIVAWNVDGVDVVNIPCDPGEYAIYDMLGGTVMVNNSESQLSVNIGPCPIYIIKR